MNVLEDLQKQNLLHTYIRVYAKQQTNWVVAYRGKDMFDVPYIVT